MDIRNIAITIAALTVLIGMYVIGNAVGRSNLAREMLEYGCDKVIGYTIK